MLSHGTFHLLLKIFKSESTCRIIPFTWNNVNQRFEILKYRKGIEVHTFNLIEIIITFPVILIYGYQIIVEDLSLVEKLTISFYCSFVLIGIICTWTTIWKSNQLRSLANSIVQIQLQSERLTLKSFEKKSASHGLVYYILRLLILNQLTVPMLCTLFFATTGAPMNLTFYLVYKNHQHRRIGSICYALICGIFAWKTMGGTNFMISLMLVYLKFARIWIHKMGLKIGNNTFQITEYRQAQMIHSIFRDALCYECVPSFVVFVTGSATMGLTCLVKDYSVMPHTLMLIYVTCLTAGLGCSCLFLKQCGDVVHNSRKLLQLYSNQIRRKKCRLLVKSCQSLKIPFGPFFQISESTSAVSVKFTMENTVTLILAT